MAEPSLAMIRIGLAEQNVLAFRTLYDDPHVQDALIGFHAQQAIEKSLKAVLSHAGVAFRRPHDIAELLDLIADASLPKPPHADQLDELNPYAVEMRYGLIEPSGLNRPYTLQLMENVVDWANREIAQP